MGSLLQNTIRVQLPLLGGTITWVKCAMLFEWVSECVLSPFFFRGVSARQKFDNKFAFGSRAVSMSASIAEGGGDCFQRHDNSPGWPGAAAAAIRIAVSGSCQSRGATPPALRQSRRHAGAPLFFFPSPFYRPLLPSPFHRLRLLLLLLVVRVVNVLVGAAEKENWRPAASPSLKRKLLHLIGRWNQLSGTLKSTHQGEGGGESIKAEERRRCSITHAEDGGGGSLNPH